MNILKKVAHLRDTVLVSLGKLMLIFRMNFRFQNREVKLPKKQISHKHVRALIGIPYLHDKATKLREPQFQYGQIGDIP